MRTGDDKLLLEIKSRTRERLIINKKYGGLGFKTFTVADLWIPQLRVWNKGAVQNLASNIDSKHILQTPLSLFKMTRIWNFESNGVYSDISLLQQLEINVHRVEGSRDLIWKIQAPLKVKNLLCRACRNCLPTRLRLHMTMGLTVRTIAFYSMEERETIRWTE